jgi:hypothetical protein
MAIEVMSWVMEHSQAETPAEQLLLLLIANHAREDGTNAFPHLDTLARRAKMNKNAVGRVISRLEKKGVVKVFRWPGFGNVYHVVLPDVVQEDPTAPPAGARGKRSSVRIDKDGSVVKMNRPASVSKEKWEDVLNALLEVCGVKAEGINSIEWRKYAKVAKALVDADATGTDIRARAFVYRRKFQVPLTANALVNHWSTLDPTVVNHDSVPQGWTAIQAARMERNSSVVDA